MRPSILINVMKNPFVPLVLLGTVCLIISCSRDDQSDREYIATVNDEKIFYDEYQKEADHPEKHPAAGSLAGFIE